MAQPSDEQLQVIGAPIAPMSVVACAGSGKTFTMQPLPVRAAREMLDTLATEPAYASLHLCVSYFEVRRLSAAGQGGILYIVVVCLASDAPSMLLLCC